MRATERRGGTEYPVLRISAITYYAYGLDRDYCAISTAESEDSIVPFASKIVL